MPLLKKTWMAGTSPAMTAQRQYYFFPFTTFCFCSSHPLSFGPQRQDGAATSRSAAARDQDADGRRPNQGESRLCFLCGGFQRFVGDLVGEEVFAALFGVLDGVGHFANPFAPALPPAGKDHHSKLALARKIGAVRCRQGRDRRLSPPARRDTISASVCSRYTQA